MTDSLRIGVLGAGSWGCALAHHLTGRGHSVELWAFEPAVAAGINERHQNPLYLSDVALDARLQATTDLERAVHQAEMILIAIPAQHVRSYLVQVRDRLPPGIPLVICSKGIERRTLATLDQVLLEELPGKHHAGICVLSGPSFAAEVARGMPTNLTAAAREVATAKAVQAAIATRTLRVYTSDDVVGVEIGGALKNVIAIAVGASDGLGFGLNTRAALITRGLAELTRLAMAMHGKPETMLGLAGVGDLVLTCTGDLSRNRQVGKLLALGQSRATIERDQRTVAEGVPTAESAYELARRHEVDLPITEQVYRVLYEDKTVQDAMAALQDRSLKEEFQR
jgi:glycerol-3-phosphate dehydrogenase (NAD(P)+)